MLRFAVLCSTLLVLCSATNGHNDELNEKQLLNIKASAKLLAKYVERPDSKDSDLKLKGARELDGEDCLLRTVCELVAHPDKDNESALVKKIRTILSRGFDNETLHFKKESYSFPYKYAAYIGTTEQDETDRTCGQTFPICSVKHEQIITLLNNL